MVIVFLSVTFLIVLSSFIISAQSLQDAVQKGDAKPTLLIGSEIKNTGKISCENGNQANQKVLVLKTKTEKGKIEELEARRWMEVTDKSCESESGEKIRVTTLSLPEPSEQFKSALKEDVEKRGVKTRGHPTYRPCSSSCVYTSGRYECWWGNRYWINYCYNECNRYTNYHYWSWQGYC